VRKSERFIKKFRSAVGGHPGKDPRLIDLTFEVKDNIDPRCSYKLLLPQPKKDDNKLTVEVQKNGNLTTLQFLREEARPRE
jgi:hypothetical protein